MEIYVCDILRGGYLCARKRPFFDDVVRGVVEEVLRERGLLGEGEWVCIVPQASEIWFGNGGLLPFYEYGFVIRREPPLRVGRVGKAYGTCMVFDDEYRETGDPCDIWAEVVDMTVEGFEVIGEGGGGRRFLERPLGGLVRQLSRSLESLRRRAPVMLWSSVRTRLMTVAL